jgi:putative nucleotidyltransferase with HDIG domain
MSSRAVPLPEDDAGGYYGVVQDITGRKVAEEGVRRRLDLEMMMSVVSSRFANATLESTAAAIDFALAEVGHHVGADRIQLYSLGSDGTTVVAVRCWSRDGDRLEDCEPLPGFAGLDWLRTRLAAGESVALRTADDLPLEATAERAVYEALGFGTVVAAPIVPDGRLSGFLVLDVDADRGGGAEAGDRRWDDDDLSILRLFADQLAGLLLWHEDEQNLRSISESFLAFGADVGENLTEVCRAAARIAGADLVVYDRRRGGSLEVETGWHLPDDLPRATTVESCVCGDLLAEPDERVRVISGLQSSVHPRTCPLAEGHDLRTLASLPVSVGGRVVALLCCLFTGDATLRDSQLELLRVLGRVAAVEEERRRANEDRVLGLAQLEQAMERTVGTLSGAMSTRDPYTAGHERRVAQLAVAIAGELGMADEERRLLGLAATVHDIGKISVPSEILSKPTRLGEAELAIIQTHAEAGWRLLEPAGLPASVTDAVLQHHERLDGSGYPAGLKGDAIGEFARILAVADVVEAMSSHRPYRPTLGIDAALEEIESGRGTRYDAGAVDACLRLFREQGFRLEE